MKPYTLYILLSCFECFLCEHPLRWIKINNSVEFSHVFTATCWGKNGMVKNVFILKTAAVVRSYSLHLFKLS